MAMMALVMPGPERGREAQCQHQPGERQEDVGDPHQHLIDPAAEIARAGADQEADAGDDHGDQHDDVERRARAVDDAREDVAAEIVGAEPMLGRWRRKPYRMSWTIGS